MDQLVQTFSRIIINPILLLLFAGGLLVFVAGVVEFFWEINVVGSHDKDAGKRHMLYGIIGMFIMASAWAIVQIIANTVGTRV